LLGKEMVAGFAEFVSGGRASGFDALAALDFRFHPTIALQLEKLLAYGFTGQGEIFC